MMFYLIQFNDMDYQTFHADDYTHALEQAKESGESVYGEGYGDITAIFQVIELDPESGTSIFPHEADDLCSHENGESVTGAVIICDICGCRQDDSPHVYSYETDWNGETGNHLSCEQNISTCDICGQSNDHKHDANEYTPWSEFKALSDEDKKHFADDWLGKAQG